MATNSFRGRTFIGDSSLVKKPVTKKKRNIYKPPSLIPGIPHFIEGMPTSEMGSPITLDYTQHADRHGERIQNAQRLANALRSKAFKRETKAFELKQQARKRIQPIADPESGRSERRRKAARRRMRGRLGTLLSERQSL
jgi:hypothetical protein